MEGVQGLCRKEVIFMMDLEFIERRKKYILACIEEPNDYHSLNCLYHMVKI